MNNQLRRLQFQLGLFLRRRWLLIVIVIALVIFTASYFLHYQYVWAPSLFDRYQGEGAVITNKRFDAHHDEQALLGLTKGQVYAIAHRRFEHGDGGKGEAVIAHDGHHYKTYVKQTSWENEALSFLLDRLLLLYRVPLAVPRTLHIKNNAVEGCLSETCSWEGIGNPPRISNGPITVNLYLFIDDVKPTTLEGFEQCFDADSGLANLQGVYQMGERIEFNPYLGDLRLGRYVIGELDEYPCTRRAILELSNLIVFDHLIANGGRWLNNGEVKNIFSSPSFGTDGFVFLDNAVSFNLERKVMTRQLYKICTFSSELIKKLLPYRTASLANALKTRMHDVFGAALSADAVQKMEKLLPSLDTQVTSFFEHYDQCIHKHGHRHVVWDP